MRFAKTTFALFSSALLLASTSSAQTELYSIIEGHPLDKFAADMTALDDIDGDGDFAVSDFGIVTTFPGGAGAVGEIYAYSGASGALLWTATQDFADIGGPLGGALRHGRRSSAALHDPLLPVLAPRLCVAWLDVLERAGRSARALSPRTGFRYWLPILG